MGRTFLLLPCVLLLSSPALANTAKELEDRARILKEVGAVFAEADIRLPPCEGHDRASEVALRYEPPRSCPKARAFYDSIVQMDSSLRANCHEMSRWLEGVLRDPELCFESDFSDRINGATTKLNAFKKEMFPGIDLLDEPDAEPAEELVEKGQGEFSRMECSLPVVIGMQFRKKQLMLANKHYGVANTILYESCEKGMHQESAEGYLRILRSGWGEGL